MTRKLPPLPEAECLGFDREDHDVLGYTADQMYEYALLSRRNAPAGDYEALQVEWNRILDALGCDDTDSALVKIASLSAPAPAEMTDEEIDKAAEDHDLYSIQDNGRISCYSLRECVRDLLSRRNAPQPEATQPAINDNERKTWITDIDKAIKKLAQYWRCDAGCIKGLEQIQQWLLAAQSSPINCECDTNAGCTRVCDRTAQPAPIPVSVSDFDISLASIDAYDPQSFINGADWMAGKYAAPCSADAKDAPDSDYHSDEMNDAVLRGIDKLNEQEAADLLQEMDTLPMVDTEATSISEANIRNAALEEVVEVCDAELQQYLSVNFPEAAAVCLSLGAQIRRLQSSHAQEAEKGGAE